MIAFSNIIFDQLNAGVRFLVNKSVRRISYLHLGDPGVYYGRRQNG